MSKTFESACTLKDDVRELIPEFYTLSGMFQNINNLNLGQGKIDTEGNIIYIKDVSLPPWCDNNPTTFVAEMRKFLEVYSDKLNKWIDLIFGSCQRGEKAEEANNIFMAQTYEKMIKIEEITDPDYRGTLMRLNEIGVTPYKIFFNDSRPRFDKVQFFQKSSLYSYSKGSFLYDCKQLEKITFKSKNYKKLYTKKDKNSKNEIQKNEIFPKIIKINWVDNETLKIFTNTNQFYDIKFTIIEKDVTNSDLEIHNFENTSSKYASSYQITSLNNNAFIVYGKCKYILKGGFWDGRIEFNSIPTEPKEQPISKSIFSHYGKPIIVMEMSEDEKYLMCGTTTGLVSIYGVDGDKINNIDNLFLHSDEITSISINNTLNMFATVSKDGYLLLYILPSFNLVRAIKLSTKIKTYKFEKKEETITKNEIKEDKQETNGNIEEDKKEKNIEENKEETKVEGKEEEKEENKEEKNNENKEEVKDEIKEENKNENKEENKEEKNNENKEEVKTEIKEENKIEEKINGDNDKKDKIEEDKNENKLLDLKKVNDNNDSTELGKISKENSTDKININESNNQNIGEENEDSEEEEQIYADNVFLSSSPIPCVTVYISQKKLFRTYTINGEFVSEEKEDDEYGSQFIKCPKVFKNLHFQDFLIYGTDKGCVKVRAFPKMNLIGNVLEVSQNSNIETLEISKDKRYCYVWSKGNEISIIKDISVSSIQVSENISRMGFNIGIN